VIRAGRRIATRGPGDVFGEIAVLRSGRRIATVVATSPLRLITVLNGDVWRLEREAHAIAEAPLAVVERRATETLDAG
jgi:CRP-like cAMP-binding protein